MDLASACEAAAKTFRPHSCIPERSFLQSTGFVDVRMAPMLPSGFRTVTNTMRHSTLAANTARVKKRPSCQLLISRLWLR